MNFYLLKKKILSFKIESTYDQARNIADSMVISLMKYWTEPIYQRTFASTVTRTFKSNMDIAFNASYNRSTDDSTRELVYRITIFEMKGNRGSVLSPSQNPIYTEIIAVKEVNEIFDQLGINKGDNDNNSGEKNNEGE